MSRVSDAATRLLADISTFSRLVIKVPLRGYQVECLNAILDSILGRRGREFLLVFPRQSGKNEAVAQLLAYLMNLHMRKGGEIVYAAVADTVQIGVSRLEQRLENPWNHGQWVKGADPTRRSLGPTTVYFLSSYPSAYTRGRTASILLVIDEAQEQDANHIEAVFTPMRAANNATAVYTGTVKSTSDFLWQKKRQLEALEADDGIQRVFFVTPDQVTAENRDYGRFLAGQVARYGRHHPIVASEYFLEPIDGTGGLFDARRRLLMHGSHAREAGPRPGALYVATLDVAGEDEAATDPLAQLKNPARDYTACTVSEVVFPSTISSPAEPHAGGGGRGLLPIYHAVDILVDHGTRHFSRGSPAPSLADRIAAYLDHWQVAHLVSDCTGVGLGLTSHLRARLGEQRVTPYDFSQPLAKAQLGSAFLALIETNRFQYWTGDEDQPLSDGWWFWQQAAACAYEIPPEGTIDRNLRWGVHPAHRTQTPLGLEPTHDDRLVSAALIAELDGLFTSGRLSLGLGRSAVIPARDPLRDPVY
jgi:hypothetical protein